jgi:hypothetical protein
MIQLALKCSIAFSINSAPISIVRITKIYLNESDRKVRTGKHICGAFPYQNDLKRIRCFIARVFQLCFRIRNNAVSPNRWGRGSLLVRGLVNAGPHILHKCF